MVFRMSARNSRPRNHSRVIVETFPSGRLKVTGHRSVPEVGKERGRETRRVDRARSDLGSRRGRDLHKGVLGVRQEGKRVTQGMR